MDVHVSGHLTEAPIIKETVRQKQQRHLDEENKGQTTRMQARINQYDKGDPFTRVSRAYFALSMAGAEQQCICTPMIQVDVPCQ